jgi:hypothetical protein
MGEVATGKKRNPARWIKFEVVLSPAMVWPLLEKYSKLEVVDLPPSMVMTGSRKIKLVLE